MGIGRICFVRFSKAELLWIKFCTKTIMTGLESISQTLQSASQRAERDYEKLYGAKPDHKVLVYNDWNLPLD